MSFLSTIVSEWLSRWVGTGPVGIGFSQIMGNELESVQSPVTLVGAYTLKIHISLRKFPSESYPPKI